MHLHARPRDARDVDGLMLLTDRTILQPGHGEHLFHQLIQLLDVLTHARKQLGMGVVLGQVHGRGETGEGRS